MDAEEESIEKRISKSELQEEELDHELSRAEKKATIRALKKQYGHDWKQMAKDALGSLKINRENMQTLHGTGADLRSYNDPRMFRR